MLRFPEEIIEMYRDMKPVYNRVYRIVHDSLLSGKVVIEGRFTEEAVSKALGVSRTPVRTAFEMLWKDGILQNFEKNGNGSYGLTEKERNDLLYLDEVLECKAAYLAAKRGIPEADLEVLQALNDALMEYDWEEIRKSKLRVYAYRDIGMQFQLMVARASGNSFLYKKIAELRKIMRTYRSNEEADPDSKSFDHMGRVRINQELLAALTDRDPRRAEMLMRYRHIMGRTAYKNVSMDLYYQGHYRKEYQNGTESEKNGEQED